MEGQVLSSFPAPGRISLVDGAVLQAAEAGTVFEHWSGNTANKEYSTGYPNTFFT